MSPQIEVIESRLFSAGVADEIALAVQEAISDHGHCSLVLSGGSTPAAVYRDLSKPPRVTEIDWPKVSLYWGDERFVPPSDDQSNFRMVKETLISHLPEPGPKVVPINTEISSAQASADQYEKLIQKNLGLTVGALPVFDILLLGVGEDGHIASVFPGSELLKSQSGICRAVKHPLDGSERITLTPQAIFSARKVLFIVKGESKASIMKRVIEGNEDSELLPAKLGLTAPGQVTWFLDSGAAFQLESKSS